MTSPQHRLSPAGIFGAVLTASLAAGYHVATGRMLQREVVLARNIGLPLGNIVHLARFAEQPCASIEAGLTGDDRLAQYVRSEFFVKGRSYLLLDRIRGARHSVASVHRDHG
ncbi:hypothetical protein PQR75_46400 [Paraburkholderia fungorum]|uniref:hypothetical protein n=1 Tax=Paraburkholderia fungorum TaxID=134537 RepID=UPI0038B9D859